MSPDGLDLHANNVPAAMAPHRLNRSLTMKGSVEMVVLCLIWCGLCLCAALRPDLINKSLLPLWVAMNVVFTLATPVVAWLAFHWYGLDRELQEAGLRLGAVGGFLPTLAGAVAVVGAMAVSWLCFARVIRRRRSTADAGSAS